MMGHLQRRSITEAEEEEAEEEEEEKEKGASTLHPRFPSSTSTTLACFRSSSGSAGGSCDRDS
jgi:hypothetical protein